jgi:hypothetical protein
MNTGHEPSRRHAHGLMDQCSHWHVIPPVVNSSSPTRRGHGLELGLLKALRSAVLTRRAARTPACPIRHPGYDPISVQDLGGLTREQPVTPFGGWLCSDLSPAGVRCGLTSKCL